MSKLRSNITIYHICRFSGVNVIINYTLNSWFLASANWTLPFNLLSDRPDSCFHDNQNW